ncbi:VC2046/SO_2500 family protein [Psychrosphaera aquimarina]|uniref:VC2046/SO_2500 family protein n=1 Tax=Psychrosphaera aquimarina TaxID=2044854 RepID=A0ABU3QWC3_9GAMM|nr:VC2046/SO_2500 family protein [Psychrosphaera aquimarina]MDU0111727.1 VC2046/SO_2500 family protein [Psychrosphaera aquimarina]
MQTQTKEPIAKNIQVIRESSVFSDIQKSVHSNDSSAFSLLLAMVTQDRMELDEFHLPKNKKPKTTSDLEKTFHVVPKKLIDKVNNEQDLMFNQLINSGYRESVSLMLNLHPQPLISTNSEINNPINIPAKLFNSLDINQQAKLYQEIQSKTSNVVTEAPVMTTDKNTDDENIEMDVGTWFSVLEQARTLSKVA